MLVLSRKPLESVVVGGGHNVDRLLTVTVLEIKHGRVRLGFEAPDEVPIHRSEIWECVKNGDQPGEMPLDLDETIMC